MRTISDLKRSGVRRETELRIGGKRVQAWFSEIGGGSDPRNSVRVYTLRDARIEFAEETTEVTAIVSSVTLFRAQYASHLIRLDRCDVRLA